MKRQILIVRSVGREYSYGVGTYLLNLIEGFKSIEEIDVYILDISKVKKGDTIRTEHNGNIHTIYLPFCLSPKNLDNEKNILNEEASFILANLLISIINLNNSIVYINSFHEYCLAKALKELLKERIKTCIVFHTATKQNIFPYNYDFKSFFSIFDKYIFPSKFCLDFYLNEYHFDKSKCIIIYNGISRITNDKVDTELYKKQI